MPIIINKTTNEVLEVRDESQYNTSDWFILDGKWIADNGVPGFSRDLWKYENGLIVQRDLSSEELLNQAKQNKINEIVSWYNNKLITGFDTGEGYFLAATISDQTRFTQDAVLQTQLVSLSLANNSDTIAFLDINGLPHTLTISNYLSLLASYGSWCRLILIKQATLLGQVYTATTIEQVSAINVES